MSTNMTVHVDYHMTSDFRLGSMHPCCRHTFLVVLPLGIVIVTSHSWLVKPFAAHLGHVSAVIHTLLILLLSGTNCLHFG